MQLTILGDTGRTGFKKLFYWGKLKNKVLLIQFGFLVLGIGLGAVHMLNTCSYHKTTLPVKKRFPNGEVAAVKLEYELAWK